MTFQKFIGANPQIHGLEQSIYSGNILQSILLTGSYGTGKTMIADIYTNALLCSSQENKPCGTCNVCKKFVSNNHPDVIRIGGPHSKSIGVDDIHILHKEAMIKPNEGGRKVFIINYAHLMTEQAQNALLKLLEEPPSYLSILLLCQSTAPLLDTILSRCVTLPMPMLTLQQISHGLQQQGIDQVTAQVCAASANGSMGKAMDMLDDKAQETRQKYCDIFFRIHHDKVAAFQMANELRSDTRNMLALWQSLTRDALSLKLHQIDNIENTDKIDEIRNFAESLDQEHLLHCMDVLCQAETRVLSNAQFPIVMDWILSRI